MITWKHFGTIVAPLLASAGLCAAASHPAGIGAKSTLTGTIVECTNAASYTYVLVDTGTNRLWAAGPQCPVKTGDKITLTGGMEMTKFESKSLKRTFDRILFVESIRPAGQMGASGMASPHGEPDNNNSHTMMLSLLNKQQPASVTNFSGLSKAAGGLTVAEIFAQRKTLENTQVTVRGKVVKQNPRILGKNWMHLQDGTGGPGANDLVLTTTNLAQSGDTVLVRGKVVLNKDVGAGYRYELLLEDAQVTVEPQSKPRQ